MPGKRRSPARWRASAAPSRALDGMQPTFTHVPPKVPTSTITADRFRRRAAIAAANAPPPEPITARSYWTSGALEDVRVRAMFSSVVILVQAES
jgi:hypothetical protein